MHRTRRVLLCVVVSALSLSLPPAPALATSAPCPEADVSYDGSNHAQLRAGLLCLVNNERTERGMKRLTADASLDRAAQRHVEDMVARGYFDHFAPPPAPYGATPVERAAAAGYRSASAGVRETIYFGMSSDQRRTDMPRTAVASWMASIGHCRALLSPTVRHLGGGITRHAVPPFASGQPDPAIHTWALVLGGVHDEGLGCPANQLVTPAPGAEPPAPVPLPIVRPTLDDIKAGGAPGEDPSRGSLPSGDAGVSAGRVVRLKGRRAALVALTCRRDEGVCRGSVALRARGRSGTVLAQRRVRLRAGVTTTVRLRIRPRARRLLAGMTRARLRMDVDGARSARIVALRS